MTPFNTPSMITDDRWWPFKVVRDQKRKFIKVTLQYLETSLDFLIWWTHRWCSGYESLNKLHYKLTRRLEYIRFDFSHMTLESLQDQMIEPRDLSISHDIITWHFVNQSILNFILLVKPLTSDCFSIFTFQNATT